MNVYSNYPYRSLTGTPYSTLMISPEEVYSPFFAFAAVLLQPQRLGRGLLRKRFPV